MGLLDLLADAHTRLKIVFFSLIWHYTGLVNFENVIVILTGSIFHKSDGCIRDQSQQTGHVWRGKI